ncbi:MAG TPA: CRISPR system precrRNA processing endoribonuclease RAMP protein Cas6 [Roseiflexaceae bacterium]|nr:CRISPR system precrRNA processing endoribonuclease RAMP protein Cas6 [Roseiflexaceae bacterium]
MRPDLYALVIRLMPETGGPAPETPGHQLQALFFELVRQVDPELANTLHADAASKHFTVAALPPASSRPAERSTVKGRQDTLALRVTLLHADLFAPFTRALLEQTARPALRLGSTPLRITEACGTPESDPWAGFGTWTTLHAAAQATERLTLRFVTPTAFSQGEDAGRKRVGVLPDPETVFGSLLRRWNALAPMQLDEAAVRQAAARAVIADYEMRTTTFALGKAPQVGFVGRCRYELRGDPDERRQLALLADAAFYLSVGMKTTRGMGLCRRVG